MKKNIIQLIKEYLNLKGSRKLSIREFKALNKSLLTPNQLNEARKGYSTLPDEVRKGEKLKNGDDPRGDSKLKQWWNDAGGHLLAVDKDKGDDVVYSQAMCAQQLDYGYTPYYISVPAGSDWLNSNSYIAGAEVEEGCNGAGGAGTGTDIFDTNGDGIVDVGFDQSWICCSVDNDDNSTMSDLLIASHGNWGFDVMIEGEPCYCPFPSYDNLNQLEHCHDGDTEGGLYPLDYVSNEVTVGATIQHFNNWINQIANTGGSISTDQNIDEFGVWQLLDDSPGLELDMSSNCLGCLNEDATNYTAGNSYTAEPDDACEFTWCDIPYMNGDGGTTLTSAYICNIYPEYCGGEANGALLTTNASDGYPSAVVTSGNCSYTGCLDDTANNYICVEGAPLADDTTYCSDDGVFQEPTGIEWINAGCSYDVVIMGCMDEGACNYNADATDDDGSCEYATCAGCMDDSGCNIIGTDFICTDVGQDNLDCTPGNIVTGQMAAYYAGCNAADYDPTATVSGTCCYTAGCDDNSVLFDSNGDAYNEFENYDSAACFNPGNMFCVATEIIEGCTDPLSQSYDTGNPANTLVADACDMTNYCTNPLATNYVCINEMSLCTQDDTLNTVAPYNEGIALGLYDNAAYPTTAETTDALYDYYIWNTNDDACIFPAAQGCTYESAQNYDPTAEADDGSCIWYFCNDDTAFNYIAESPYGVAWDPTYAVPCNDPGDCGGAIATGNGSTYVEGGCIYEGCPSTYLDAFISIHPNTTSTSPGVEYVPTTSTENGGIAYTLNDGNYGCQPPGEDFPIEGNTECCYIPGCNVEEAFQYSDTYTIEQNDNCCIRFACRDPQALNYDPTCTGGSPNYCCASPSNLGAGHSDFGAANSSAWNTGLGQIEECEYPPVRCADVVVGQCGPIPVEGCEIPTIMGGANRYYQTLTCVNLDVNGEIIQDGAAMLDYTLEMPAADCMQGFIYDENVENSEWFYGDTSWVDAMLSGANQSQGCYFDPTFNGGRCRPSVDLQQEPSPTYYFFGTTPGVQSLDMNWNQSWVQGAWGYPQDPYPQYHFGNDNPSTCQQCNNWCWQNRPAVENIWGYNGSIYGCYTPAIPCGEGANNYVYAACTGAANYGDYGDEGIYGDEGNNDWFGDFGPGGDFAPEWQGGGGTASTGPSVAIGDGLGGLVDLGGNIISESLADEREKWKDERTDKVNNLIKESKDIRKRLSKSSKLLKEAGPDEECHDNSWFGGNDPNCETPDAGCCCDEYGWLLVSGAYMPIQPYDNCSSHCCGGGCGCTEVTGGWMIIDYGEMYETTQNNINVYTPNLDGCAEYRSGISDNNTGIDNSIYLDAERLQRDK